MALIECPDCGNFISTQAAACIHCGRPMEPEPPKPSQLLAPVAPPIKPQGRQSFVPLIVGMSVIGIALIILTDMAYSRISSTISEAAASSQRRSSTTITDNKVSITNTKVAFDNSPPKQWRTVYTWVGNTHQETPSFPVPTDEWRIKWSFNCTSHLMQNFAIWVHGKGSDFEELVANELGASGASTSNMHQAGRFYLDITGRDNWKVEVQEAL